MKLDIRYWLGYTFRTLMFLIFLPFIVAFGLLTAEIWRRGKLLERVEEGEETMDKQGRRRNDIAIFMLAIPWAILTPMWLSSTSHIISEYGISRVFWYRRFDRLEHLFNRRKRVTSAVKLLQHISKLQPEREEVSFPRYVPPALIQISRYLHEEGRLRGSEIKKQLPANPLEIMEEGTKDLIDRFEQERIEEIKSLSDEKLHDPLIESLGAEMDEARSMLEYREERDISERGLEMEREMNKRFLQKLQELLIAFDLETGAEKLVIASDIVSFASLYQNYNNRLSVRIIERVGEGLEDYSPDMY